MHHLTFVQASFLLLSGSAALVSACGSTYAQCGGKSFIGKTCCVSGSTCVAQNDYYSQCLPGTQVTSAKTTSSRFTTSTKPASTSTKATVTTKPATSTKVAVTTKVSTTSKAPAPTTPVTGGIVTKYTGPKSGDGTQYGNDGSGGNCKLPARADLAFVAWPGPVYENAHYCGACLKITGSASTQFAQITNKCPECKPGDLDMSSSLMQKVSGSQGREHISWEFVDCVSAGLTSGQLSYIWKSGSSQHWAQVQVRNAGLPIESVQVNGQTLIRQDYNYFGPASGGLGPGPFTIKTNFQDGTSKTETGIVLNGKIEDA